MEGDTKNIYSEFRQLIMESCAFNEVPLGRFQNFHHDFLKFFFGAMQVVIDYQNKTITLWSPKPISKESFTSFNINTSVIATVSYADLEATLLGCVEEGHFQLRFYAHLIHEYGPSGAMKNPDNEMCRA